MKNKPVIIKANNWIEKQNLLNEIKSNYMSLQEIRFFTIYLSKINPRDLSTRVVTFPMSDFLKIMDIGKINLSVVKSTTDKLLCKIVNIRNENGGYVGFQLFKKCTVDKDEFGDWFVSIDAHDDSLPLMFEFKKNYFKYELWNTLRLKSANQIRMYEILKQYEKLGERIVTIKDLKGFLGIDEKKYPRFGDLKNWVIDRAQHALAEHTDICFEYELIKKGAKVISVKFIVKKNKIHSDQLSLENFIDLQSNDSMIDLEPTKDSSEKDFSLFSETFDNEFILEQVKELYTMAIPFAKRNRQSRGFDIAMSDYLSLKFSQLNAARNVKFRYGYLKRLIQVDLDEQELGF